MAKLQPARTYVISNASVLGAGRLRPFRHTAPVGSIVVLRIGGRPMRVLLTGTPLNGSLLRAELLFTAL
ncbi:hypothetical protein ACWGH2_41950 [Streptomyces sp. NPDC054871]